MSEGDLALRRADRDAWEAYNGSRQEELRCLRGQGRALAGRSCTGAAITRHRSAANTRAGKAAQSTRAVKTYKNRRVSAAQERVNR